MFKKFFICFVLLSTGVSSLGMFSSRRSLEVPTIKSSFNEEKRLTEYGLCPPEKPAVSSFEVSLNSEKGRCSKLPKKPNRGMFSFRRSREVPTIKSSFNEEKRLTEYVLCPPEKPKARSCLDCVRGFFGRK